MRKGDGEAGDFDDGKDRLVCHDGMWFFATREGRKGPYLSRVDAENVMSSYVEAMEYLEDRRIPTQFDPTDVTIINLERRLDSDNGSS